MRLIVSVIAIVGVIIATFTDIRNNIIPNKLTYPLIVVGVILNLGVYLYQGDLFRAFYGIIGGSIAFGIGLLLYILGGWAGGDVKLLTGLAALAPVAPNPFFSDSSAILFSNLPLFSVTILLNGIIIAAPFIIGYMILCSVRGEGVMTTTVSISDLKEGSVPDEAVWEKDGKVKKGDSLPEEYDKYYLNPDKLEVIEGETLEEIRKLYDKGVLDEVKIKKIFPFAPVIAAGTILAIFFGNIYWIIIT